ncbi:MAG TPA: cellulase family glycosylhydrolase, partial [Candidatus Caenarcaniphilales bacterium]
MSFKVSGTQILDPNGKEFIIKGVNINGLNWVWPDDMTQPAHLDKIVNCWKFNLVRVNCHLFFTNSPWPQFRDNNDLDKIVNAYTSRKVVVMFDGHERIGGYYEGGELTTLKNWYRDLAVKYKNNPYVWFDIQNEPGAAQPDKAKWLAVMQGAVKAIRDEAGASNIIMVEGTAWGQDAGNWNSSPVPQQNSSILQYGPEVMNFGGKSYSNIIFNIHVYDQWNFGDARLADYFDRVRAKNMVITVGEFGVRNAGQDTTAATRSLYNTA